MKLKCYLAIYTFFDIIAKTLYLGHFFAQQQYVGQFTCLHSFFFQNC